MSDINILIIEDDLEINRFISRYLTKEGYSTTSASNGLEAVNLLTSKPWHLVILDLMLPYMDGYEILRKIRENDNVPVLILSAKAENTDKIIGLGLGADDYLTKPFQIDELLARVKAHIRRYVYFGSMSLPSESILKHMDLEMNVENHEVMISGQTVILTAKEFDILKLLLSNPKRVFTKAQVFTAVWGDEYLGDENTVMVHIRRLREKIEPDPSNPRYVQTVWGIGYKMAEVQR